MESHDLGRHAHDESELKELPEEASIQETQELPAMQGRKRMDMYLGHVWNLAASPHFSGKRGSDLSG